MSNAGQAALGIVGGVVGFVLAGPAGAAYGLQLGLAVGTIVSPTQLPGTFGPRLTDQRTTSAQMGAPIPELFGTDVVAGQVIWLGDVVEHAETEEVGGKGGPEGENTTFSYTQSIAIGLCKGPQFGVRRIWENGKLVYDARPQLDGESDEAYLMRTEAAITYAEGFTLYLGDEDQLPDPTIELKEGVGNVPAYRGLMYIVFTDRLLQSEQGQRHPTFKFEIAAADIPLHNLTPARTHTSSFTITAGQNSGNTAKGFGEIDPFDSFGVITAPGTVDLLGGLFGVITAEVKQVLFATLFSPPSFNIILEGPFFESLIKSVQVSTTGNPVFQRSAATTSGTQVDGGYSNAELVSQIAWSAPGIAQFVVGQPYTVTVTSELPEGFETQNVMTAGDDGSGHRGYAVVATGTGVAAPFGAFVGVAPISGTAETQVLALYQNAIGSGISELVLVIEGNYPGMSAAVHFEGDSGKVVFGARVGNTALANTVFKWPIKLSAFTVSIDYLVSLLIVPAAIVAPPQPLAPLSTIVERICNRCGLNAIDVTDLEDVIVNGYKIDRLTDARSAISVLRQVGFFDAVESTEAVKFVRRGGAPVRTLTERDLGAHQFGDEAPPLVTTRTAQDTELPRQLFVQYRDPARDYEDGQQASPTRLTTDAVNDITVDVSVAITGTQALQAAEMLWADMWAGRWQHSIVLDAAHSDLEPTDVVLVPVDGRLERMRIVSTEDAALVLRTFALVRDDDGSYVSDAIAEPPAAVPAPLGILDGSDVVLLDLPPLRAQDDDAGVYAVARRAGAGNRWGGTAIYRGLAGSALSALASITSEAVVGTLGAPLGSGPHTIFDDGNDIEVELPRGQFESRPDEDLLELGANTLAIGAHGRWELVQFAAADQVGPTSWVLSRLLRGRRGTEHNIGTAQLGDTVVLVSGAGVIRLPINTANVSEPFVYRAVTIGATLGSGVDQSFAGTGEALKPFSPVHVVATDVGGDLLIEWTRRDRLAVEFTDPLPMSEDVEAYEVDILGDSSPAPVLRTLTSSTPSVTYTAAQQLLDFGGPPPTAIAVRIYQLGELGRGHAAETII